VGNFINKKMRPHSVLFSLVSVFIFLAFFSCKDDEISTNPAHRLSFSNDTIFFDTIFAEVPAVPTITGSFRFYNRNNKPLEISKIELLNDEYSSFRINIPNADEPNSDINHNVFIRGNDSLFVFVDLKPHDFDNDEPQKMEAELAFHINGNIQKIKLLAYSQSVISFDNEVENYVFTAKRPYLIKQDLTINGNADFNAGARIFMRDKANLIINGNLTIDGTLEKPVIIRGERRDYMLQNLPYDFIPGQWGSIKLTSTGAIHDINHAHIRNGEIGLLMQGENTRLNVRNSWIHNFDFYGIIARNSFVKAENSVISNCGTSCVDIAGGESEFTYVTFANYYRNFKPSANNRNRTMPSVLISNYITDENATQTPAPLNKADFLNCIIYGNIYSELGLNQLEEMDEIPFNYSFTHCLIKAKEEAENDRFTGILWNEDPLFVNTNANNEAINFHLQENSPAINQAFDELHQFPFDFDGNSRYADEKPDLGAFEFAPTLTE
jgi:hypothetical protein